ncbi:replication-relaxation family protein [Streptomyces sp. NPDC059459]|uniref:replication-relaxation family protein n=1 Tax=Streptomyces sp. NPDC059459 TaxID=3346839 RepID=UPI003676E6DF
MSAKVSTVEQIQQTSASHLSYRHIDKPTPSKREQARTASHTGALSDLRKHGLAENGGQLPGGDTLRNLTPMGLKAAARELGRRPVGEMGNPARGAGRTGAAHPMTVNEAVLALLRPKPNLSELAGEPADVFAAGQAAFDAPAGLGTIASYATEVALPATGTWANPGKGGAQADIVITAPEDGMPLLFVEIDNCFESAQVLAAKVDKYMRFCRRSGYNARSSTGFSKRITGSPPRSPAPGGRRGLWPCPDRTEAGGPVAMRCSRLFSWPGRMFSRVLTTGRARCRRRPDAWSCWCRQRSQS